MSPAALVAELQARGVSLRPSGERLMVSPIEKVTSEEIEALRRHKPEILRLLTVPPARLDPVTIIEVLGPRPDAHDLGSVRLDVAAALARLDAGIRSGVLPPRQIIRGRPLADWLGLDEIARLLRARREARP